MRPARLLLLGAVTLGLFAFIYFYERKKPSTEELRERQGKLFPQLVAEQIRKVTIHNRFGQFELVREGGSWKLVKPIKDDAEQGAVSTLLSQLTGLKAERTLPASEVRLADYGLAQPERWVEVQDEAGTAAKVAFGQELPLGDKIAAITDGREVYLVSKWISSDVDKDLSGWRSTNLLPFSSFDVNALTVASPQGRLSAAKSGNLWTLTEPINDWGEREELEGILSDLAGARIKEFLDEGGDAKALGLDPARLTVTLVRPQGSPLTLAFGSERDQDGSRQVACQRGERLFWVEASATSHLTKKPQEFRSHQLLPFSTWQVDTLVLERGNSKITAERKEGVWRGEKGQELDSGPIFSRLNTLAELKVLAFDQPPPEGNPLGFVQLSGQEKLEMQVTFYPASESEQVLAVVKGRPKALAVDRAKVDEVLSGVEEIGRPKPTPSPSPRASSEK